MNKEREGIIWALLTDEEREEMPTRDHREVFLNCIGGGMVWTPDKLSGEPCPSYAYRPRPKPVKKYRPWTPEESIGQVVRNQNGGLQMVTRAGGDACILACSDFMKLETLLSGFECADGSPCGVEVCVE